MGIRGILHVLLLAVGLCSVAAHSWAAQCRGAIGTMTVTVPASTAKVGDPITVTWKLVNNSNGPIFGTIAIFSGSRSINSDASAINNREVNKGASINDTATVPVVPGVNKISVEFIHTQNVLVSEPPAQLTPIEGDGSAKVDGTTPPPQKSVPVQTTIASCSAPFNASPATAAVQGFLSSSQRATLFRDYAPLFLYSFDHGSDEQYAPIDVLPFIQGSGLVSKVTGIKVNNQAQGSLTANSVLNPTNDPINPLGGAVTPDPQPALPVKLFLEPSEATRHGMDWSTVMARQDPQAGTSNGPNVGLYAQAVLLHLDRFNSYDDPGLKPRLTALYNCDASGTGCPTQVIKIEYWQFFGYSYDLTPSASTAMAANLAVAALAPLVGLDAISLSMAAGASANDILDGQINHAGDWCTVQLYVDATWWQAKQYERSILAVYHYFHGKSAGFDMISSRDEGSAITVPNRSANAKGPTFSAKEYAGPNFKQQVELSVQVGKLWLPIGGPKMSEEIDHAQNNVVQLAADPATNAFQHPVAYVEWGGHEFWPSPSWSIYGASKHNGTGQFAYFGTTPVDVSLPPILMLHTTVPDDVRLVQDFAGFWGNPGGGGPPPGPILHREWLWDLTPAGLFQSPSWMSGLPY